MAGYESINVSDFIKVRKHLMERIVADESVLSNFGPEIQKAAERLMTDDMVSCNDIAIQLHLDAQREREEAKPVESETVNPDLVSSKEAAEMLGISRQAVNKGYRSGIIQGIPVGERAVVFLRDHIEYLRSVRGEGDRIRNGEG